MRRSVLVLLAIFLFLLPGWAQSTGGNSGALQPGISGQLVQVRARSHRPPRHKRYKQRRHRHPNRHHPYNHYRQRGRA